MLGVPVDSVCGGVGYYMRVLAINRGSSSYCGGVR